MNDFYTMLADELVKSKPTRPPITHLEPLYHLTRQQWNQDVSRSSIACAKHSAKTGADFNAVEFFDICGYDYKRGEL